MKKLLFSFFLTLSVSLSVVGQITQDFQLFGNYSNPVTERVRTSTMGEKVVVLYSNMDTLKLYNSDGSFFKTINLPPNYTYDDLVVLNGMNGVSIPSLSDNLFNSDNLLEFIGHNNITDMYSIINENGLIIYTFPDLEITRLLIYKIGTSFKIGYTQSNSNSYKQFSLPGTLPCDPCSGLSGLEQPNTGGGLGEMKVYPNPFNNTLQVNYDFPTNQTNPRLILTDILGRELKEIKLTSQSDNVSINTSDLPKGTIIVSLYGGQNMISKKVIKID